MLSFVTTTTLIWILTGLLALAIGTKYMNKPENRELILKQVKEIAEEIKVKDEDCICIMYVGFVLLGFVGVAVALLRRFRQHLRRNK